MYGSWWNGWTRDSSELEMSFNRYRDIAPDVEGGWLTGTVRRTGFTKCRSLEVPVWYPNDAWLVLCIHANQAGDNQQ